MIDAKAIRDAATITASTLTGLVAGALATLAIQHIIRRARAARGGRS